MISPGLNRALIITFILLVIGIAGSIGQASRDHRAFQSHPERTAQEWQRICFAQATVKAFQACERQSLADSMKSVDGQH